MTKKEFERAISRQLEALHDIYMEYSEDHSMKGVSIGIDTDICYCFGFKPSGKKSDYSIDIYKFYGEGAE